LTVWFVDEPDVALPVVAGWRAVREAEVEAVRVGRIRVGVPRAGVVSEDDLADPRVQRETRADLHNGVDLEPGADNRHVEIAPDHETESGAADENRIAERLGELHEHDVSRELLRLRLERSLTSE
jgi:hypothetical protein